MPGTLGKEAATCGLERTIRARFSGRTERATTNRGERILAFVSHGLNPKGAPDKEKRATLRPPVFSRLTRSGYLPYQAHSLRVGFLIGSEPHIVLSGPETRTSIVLAIPPYRVLTGLIGVSEIGTRSRDKLGDTSGVMWSTHPKVCSMAETSSAEAKVREIRRKTRRRFSCEEKIRIVSKA